MTGKVLRNLYPRLRPDERFRLSVEAVARKDWDEFGLLSGSCPTYVYRCEDAEFRDRVRRAYGIAVTVCLNMRQGIARIRMAKAFKDTSSHFAGPVARIVTAAYLCGRSDGRAEAGGHAEQVPSNGVEMVEMLTSDVSLQGQLDEIRSVAEEAVGQFADLGRSLERQRLTCGGRTGSWRRLERSMHS